MPTAPSTPQSTEEQESIKLNQHQWNVLMDILRVDINSGDVPDRLGDVAGQARDILDAMEKQLGRDGVERH